MTKSLSRTLTDRTQLGLLFAMLFMAMAMTGCNTARGVGEDASAAGDVITEPFEDDDEDASPSG